MGCDIYYITIITGCSRVRITYPISVATRYKA